MKPRIVFLHGNQATHWSFAYAAWLKEELEKLGYPTFFETLPDSIIARSEYWMPFLENRVKVGENDVIVGWSSGGTAAMRYAENHKIKGSVLIAPSYTDLGDELEKQSGYFDKPWDWEAIRNNQDKIVLIHSDNDPYIPLEQFKFIIKQLHAKEINLPGKGHFVDEPTLPELLSYIQENY